MFLCGACAANKTDRTSMTHTAASIRSLFWGYNPQRYFIVSALGMAENQALLPLFPHKSLSHDTRTMNNHNQKISSNGRATSI